MRDDLTARRVETLIVVDCNPVYDAPGDLHLAIRSARSRSAHLGLYHDETADRCTWHLPLSHVLESWSDLRALDGTASIVQPLIRPLYDTRTAHDLLAFMRGAASRIVPRSRARDLAGTRRRELTSRLGGGRRCTTA